MKGWLQTARRNRVGAVCSCGRFMSGKDHATLVERLEKHFRNCPTYTPEEEAPAATGGPAQADPAATPGGEGTSHG